MNPWIEWTAVALGLLYLILAIRQWRSCWIAGGAASALFLLVFWRAALPMQSLLQIYYVGIAVHAWFYWGDTAASSRAAIARTGLRQHAIYLGLWGLLSLASCMIIDISATPLAWLDITSSWGGVIATWMVARKELEAWLYWIAIDIASALLYANAGLSASAGLFVVYTVLAFIAWKEWRLSFQKQNAN